MSPKPRCRLSDSCACCAQIHFGVEAGGQFVISSHSPILLAYSHAVIYRLDDSGVRGVRYEETEQYSLTKSFLQAPDRFSSCPVRPIELAGLIKSLLAGDGGSNSRGYSIQTSVHPPGAPM